MVEDTFAALSTGVGVDHGSFQVFVAEEFLNSADVIASFEEVGGEGVPKGVGGDVLVDTGKLNRFFDGLLEVPDTLEVFRQRMVIGARSCVRYGLTFGYYCAINGSRLNGWIGLYG